VAPAAGVCSGDVGGGGQHLGAARLHWVLLLDGGPGVVKSGDPGSGDHGKWSSFLESKG